MRSLATRCEDGRNAPGERRRLEGLERDGQGDRPVGPLLDGAGAAWVLADRPGWRVPLVVTAGWAYVRFHQGRALHPSYTRSKLRTWADRIAGLDAKDVFVFFNNDQLAAAPRDAETLTGFLLDRGQEVAPPPG